MLLMMFTDRVIAIATLISSSFATLAILFEFGLGRFLDSRQERKSKRDAIVVRYVSQLQATVQLFAERLGNLTKESGRGKMTSDYFQFTTLYSLACPLALERIFMFDGVYPQIKAFSENLYSYIHGWSLDKQLKGFGFHRYDRIALAECAMKVNDSGFRLATYFEFRERYEKALGNKDQWLISALKFAEAVTDERNHARIEAISISLNCFADQLAKHTGISRREEGDQ
jgi:hypothetical protein